MRQMKRLTQRSILVILLVSNTIHPLFAFSDKTHHESKKSQQISKIFEKIKNLLVDKGLNEDVAIKKTRKLLAAQQKSIKKLEILCANGNFLNEKSKLFDTLATYALHERSLDINSYSSLIGLAQNVLSRPLRKSEKEYLQEVTNV